MAAVELTGIKSGWSISDSLSELASLTKTAGAIVVGQITQKLSAPNKSTYFNKGKIEDLLRRKESWQFDTLIVDDELSPSQQQALEERLESRVIDRLALILDI
ncbi:MAG TPA: GTPase HflX, partial [Dehalococcoidales bacterium]|nr:GTPase HflX [Dehalococcoidales bacterium]